MVEEERGITPGSSQDRWDGRGHYVAVNERWRSQSGRMGINTAAEEAGASGSFWHEEQT